MAWIVQNWLVLCSFILSLTAVAISYRKLKHDTRPKLILRHASGFAEIENVGPVAAVGIRLTLIEREPRPTAVLHSEDVLRPGEKAILNAFDWPDTLGEELTQNRLTSFEDTLRKINGQKIRHDPRIVADYLLSREGEQVVILRFAVADGSKVFLRLFSIAQPKGRFGFPELVPSYRLLRYLPTCVDALEGWYSKNRQLAPPFVFPRIETDETERPQIEKRFG